MREKGLRRRSLRHPLLDKNDEDPREGIVEFYIIFKMYFN
jgi:hypothetical protein